MRQLRPLLLQKADHRANIDLITIIQLGKPLTEFVSVLDRPEHGHMYACNGILVKSHSKRRPHLLAEVRATVETPSKMPRCGEYATRCPQPLRGLPRHRRRLGSAKRREGAIAGREQQDQQNDDDAQDRNRNRVPTSGGRDCHKTVQNGTRRMSGTRLPSACSIRRFRCSSERQVTTTSANVKKARIQPTGVSLRTTPVRNRLVISARATRASMSER